MRLIARKDEAATALAFHRKFSSGWPYDYSALPDGWAFVGSGATRFAYLSPSNLVYKIAQADYDVRCNEHEYACIRSLRGKKMPKGYRLPHVARVKVKNRTVIVMEYIPHAIEMSELNDSYDSPKAFKIWDWSPNNCRRADDGKLVPIDFGFSNIETGFGDR